MQTLRSESGADTKSLTILVVGSAGSGKSSLVNSLLKNSQCRTLTHPGRVTERLERKSVLLSKGSHGDPKFRVDVIDTPGFSGHEETDQALKDQLRQIISFDVLICCFDISTYGGRYCSFLHFNMLETLQDVFGEECMREKCIIVLTKSNMLLDRPRHEERITMGKILEGWKRAHEEKVRKPGDEAKGFLKIPVLVAGQTVFDESGTPKGRSKIDGSDAWYGELWNGIAGRTAADIAIALATAI